MSQITRRFFTTAAALLATAPRALLANHRRAVDLIITAISWSVDGGLTWNNASVPEGSDVQFRATVKNIGKATANQTIRVDFSVDNQLVTWGVRAAGLKSGKSAVISASTGTMGDQFWHDAAAGTHTVKALVDPGNLHPSEHSGTIDGEANNALITTVDVFGGGQGGSVTPLWFANHENSTGDHETQWLTAEHAGGAPGGGGFFNSGTHAVARSTNFAHSATWSVRCEVSPVIGSGSAGIRAFRWFESRMEVDLYYSAWFYFPTLYTVTGGGQGEFFNTFQFKTRWDPQNDPTWTTDIRNGGAGGAMRLEMLHHGQQMVGTGLSFLRLTQTLNPTDIPVGQWVHFETFLHQANVTEAAAGNGSIVRVWQDGVLIFEIGPGLSHNQSKPSKYDLGDQQWSVNCYTDGTSPTPTVVYLDDAVIASERVYGKTVVGV